MSNLKETLIDLKSNNNILLGKLIILSGFLNDSEGNPMSNKCVVLYIDDYFVKNLITNDEGIFNDFLLAKYPGYRQIKCVYEGDWEYAGCHAETNVNIIGDDAEVDKTPEMPESDEENNGGEVCDIGDQLEKIANLYQKGLLSDEEFRLSKEKILKK